MIRPPIKKKVREGRECIATSFLCQKLGIALTNGARGAIVDPALFRAGGESRSDPPLFKIGEETEEEPLESGLAVVLTSVGEGGLVSLSRWPTILLWRP